MNLRVIIADDEPLSIDMLSILLSEIDPNLATVDIAYYRFINICNLVFVANYF